jgi:hypothetical protein
MCYLVNFTFFQKYIFKIDSFTAVLILQIVLLGFNYEPPSGGKGGMTHWGIALLLSDWRSVFEDMGEGVSINPHFCFILRGFAKKKVETELRGCGRWRRERSLWQNRVME